MSRAQPADAGGTASSEQRATYLAAIRVARSDPARLEELYQSARQARAVPQFKSDLLALHWELPENMLYAAWYYRFQHAEQDDQHLRHSVNWKLAIPLSALLGLVLWLLSDPHWILTLGIPYLALLWAPIAALCIGAFLTLAARGRYLRAAAVAIALAGVTAYVLIVSSVSGPAAQRSYLTLMLAHVPLLAWGAIGISLLGWGSSATSRFAFLSKSVEAIGTAGVYAIVGGIFVGLTYGMFQALSVAIPDLLLRLLVAGGAGLIPVTAVASVYDPAVGPAEQEFRRGFGKIQAILMQALLPLTLLVLVIYLFVIPFNFMQPFTNRDVLIVYNVMLFAIMGLLIGVTPVSPDDLPERYQTALRLGILAVASLVVLIGLYALAAIVYRTAQGHLTMNRLTVIGWNTINIGILALLIYQQLRRSREGWVDALHTTFRLGAALYLAWALFLTLALPWLF